MMNTNQNPVLTNPHWLKVAIPSSHEGFYFGIFMMFVLFTTTPNSGCMIQERHTSPFPSLFELFSLSLSWLQLIFINYIYWLIGYFNHFHQDNVFFGGGMRLEECRRSWGRGWIPSSSQFHGKSGSIGTLVCMEEHHITKHSRSCT